MTGTHNLPNKARDQRVRFGSRFSKETLEALSGQLYVQTQRAGERRRQNKNASAKAAVPLTCLLETANNIAALLKKHYRDSLLATLVTVLGSGLVCRLVVPCLNLGGCGSGYGG